MFDFNLLKIFFDGTGRTITGMMLEGINPVCLHNLNRYKRLLVNE